MSSPYRFDSRWSPQWKRLALATGSILAVALVVFIMTWNAFFIYVPADRHLVIVAKDGAPLPVGEVLADVGQKGIQRGVMGEGWHFVWPIIYTTEVHDNTTIPAGKVGIVTARGGKPLPEDRMLAIAGEKGMQRQILPPGTYRINRYGFDVELVDAVEIKPGFVGVLRRLLGKDGSGRFATGPDEKGILREVLQPGLYYLNTKEFEIIKTEVGIFQTTFHYNADPAKSTAIAFTSKGGFPISMDCTIEWEVLPEHMPALVADFGSRRAVERTVIDLQAHTIGRDKGIDYGVQDFLEGSKREKFQGDFTQELVRVCGEKNVTVHSAFIRDIVIPEEYLSPIRTKQIAAEKELTNRAQEITRQTEADVEREEQKVQQRAAEVEADTKRIVAAIDRQVENTLTKNQAEIEKLKAEYGAKIASLDAERTTILGQAESGVTKLKETAKNNLYQLKMEVFQNDGGAFLRYSLAEQLNPKLALRLFHSGTGTLWTNMEGKGMNLMLPAPTGAPKPPATEK
jgi:regulator of protease activity HflC (stomatin/prohibitin superfamily)